MTSNRSHISIVAEAKVAKTQNAIPISGQGPSLPSTLRSLTAISITGPQQFTPIGQRAFVAVEIQHSIELTLQCLEGRAPRCTAALLS